MSEGGVGWELLGWAIWGGVVSEACMGGSSISRMKASLIPDMDNPEANAVVDGSVLANKGVSLACPNELSRLTTSELLWHEV